MLRIRRNPVIWLTFLFSLQFVTADLVTASDNAMILTGKVYSLNGKEEVDSAIVRLVHLNRGTARETKTSKDGCYRFESLAPGNYSISISHNGVDYRLPEKLFLETQKSKMLLAACFAFEENGMLRLLESCEVCGDKKWPVYLIVAGAGLSVVIGRQLVEEEEERVASPSTPER